MQKGALRTQKSLRAQGLQCAEGDRDHGLERGQTIGVGVGPSMLRNSGPICNKDDHLALPKSGTFGLDIPGSAGH